MKVIRINNTIVSLENVQSVEIGPSVNSIRVWYTHGDLIPSTAVFRPHYTIVDYIKNVDKTMNEIFEILSKDA